MNANTLADELDDIDAYEKHQTLLGKASEMLRQQQVDLKIADDYSYILERKLKEAQAEIESLKAIVEKLTADWTDGFRNYEYNSDEPEENKLRDDVFAILRKAQAK